MDANTLFTPLSTLEIPTISRHVVANRSSERSAVERKRIRKVQQKWNRTEPIQGTLAETYLRKHRGVTVQLPNCLRFLTDDWNLTTKREHPALIVAAHNNAGEITAVQCTYLNPDTAAKITGENVKAKLTYGLLRGAVSHVSKHAERIIVTEGLEDALTLLQACPDYGVLATLGTSGMDRLQLPSQIQEIIIAADNDEVGRKATHNLANQMLWEGKIVRIIHPSAGYKDFNEMLIGVGR